MAEPGLIFTSGKGVKVPDDVDGVFRVDGSRCINRDISTEENHWGVKRGSSRPDYGHIVRPVGSKWCSEHDGDGWVPLTEFSPDSRYRDGKHPVCKLCRARHQRRMYALQKQEQGETVRPYRGSSRPSY